MAVALGNDCNAGILGEAWLGAARGAKSAVGIFVGTGIGGGFVRKGRIWQGHRCAALEVGHMVLAVDGPVCGCGNRGCFEALASRSAIERDLRQAVADGRATMLTDILDGDLTMIRSGALKRALSAGDELVTEVLHRAARTLGLGCMSVCHLLDPQRIVLGGGVMEACGDALLPVIQQVLDDDRLGGAGAPEPVHLAALGDDAVALGAVGLAQCAVGCSPFKKRASAAHRGPTLAWADGGLLIDGECVDGDVCIQVGGTIRRRKKRSADGRLSAKQVQRACEGGPEVIFIGADDGREISDKARRFLDQRAIECQLLPPADAAEAYNACDRRKAAIFQAPA